MAHVVTCLGFVSAIRYTDKKGDEYDLEFNNKNSWNTRTGKNSLLMVSDHKREITIIPWHAKPIKIPKGASAAKSLYRDWTGYDTKEAFSIKTPNKKPALIGRISRIEYTSDKFERSGDKAGQFNLYRHNFTKQQKLYANRANTILVIVSSATLWNYRGIIG